MTHTTVVANNKGGVAKSQLTVQLAAALARAGKRVLVVDLDPQANATRRLGIIWDPSAPIPTVSEAIKADQAGAGEGAVIGCGWMDDDDQPTAEAELIDLIPSRPDLGNRETEAGVVGAARRLKKALSGWTDEYDAVLIDTPPSLGHLTQLAMAAADDVLIPVAADYDSVEGSHRVDDFVRVHGADLANPNLTVAGVVVTRYKKQLEDEFQVAGLIERFGDLVWSLGGVVKQPGKEDVLLPKWLPEWARLKDADSAAVSLTAWRDERARATVGLYDKIAKTYIDRLLASKEAAA